MKSVEAAAKHARTTPWRLCAARCLLVQNSLTNVDDDRATLPGDAGDGALVSRPFRPTPSSRAIAGRGDYRETLGCL
jgi:hypothetical protein